MEPVLLGRTGVRVSPLAMGTMSFGGDADEATAAEMYGACRDAGINLFDCANGYAGGRSETILGKLIASEREEIVLTSKVGMGSNPQAGLSRRHIVSELEGSLKRLGTDHLDVYFVHRFDELTPIEETLRVLDDLVRSGKVLYLGASNWAAWQIAKGLGISAREGLSKFDVLQPMYNLVKRQAEVEILPLALEEGLAVTPYSPVGGGLLTGKYRTGKAEARRIDSNPMYAERYAPEWMKQTAIDFADFAESNGMHPVSLAVAWVGSHPAITAPLIGARSLEQLQPSLDSVKIDMTPELRDQVSALSRNPATATDR